MAARTLLIVLVVTLAIALPSPVAALVVGEPVSVSRYGDPLAIEFELMTEAKEDLASLTVTTEITDGNKLALTASVYAANHTAYVRVASAQRVWDSGISLIVKIGWRGGSVTRPYHLQLPGAP